MGGDTGRITHYTYNARSQITEIAYSAPPSYAPGLGISPPDPIAGKTYFLYDLLGRLKADYGHGRQTTTALYDGRNNFTQTIFGASTLPSIPFEKTIVEKRTYDSLGLLTSVSSGGGQATHYYYDPFKQAASLLQQA